MNIYKTYLEFYFYSKYIFICPIMFKDLLLWRQHKKKYADEIKYYLGFYYGLEKVLHKAVMDS